MSVERVQTSQFFPEDKSPRIWELSLDYFDTESSPPGVIFPTEVSFRGYLDPETEMEDVDGLAVYVRHPEATIEKVLYLQINIAGFVEEEGLLIEKWKRDGGDDFAFSLLQAREFLEDLKYRSLHWEDIIYESWDGTGLWGESLTNQAFSKYAIKMVSMSQAEDLLRLWFNIK